MSLTATLRAHLVDALSDLDAHEADAVMEREIALAAVRFHRMSGAEFDYLAVGGAFWDLIEAYSKRIDVRRAVGHPKEAL